MTKTEFAVLTKGSLKEAIDQASLRLGQELPSKNINLITTTQVLAAGWEASVHYLVDKMYFGENKILPCADLIVESAEDETTNIRVFIASYPPGPFDLNWSGGVGPYIKAVGSELLHNSI